MEFNINHNVKITLTDLGVAIYNRHQHDMPLRPYMGIEELRTYPKYRDKEPGDVIKMQMWKVMKMFGRVMANGSAVPFHPTIVLDIERGGYGRWDSEHGIE